MENAIKDNSRTNANEQDSKHSVLSEEESESD